MKPTREIRARLNLSLRALTDAEKAAGYIGALSGEIPFNSDSGKITERGLNHGRPFVEQIAPDAFKRSLADDKDIVGMIGHTESPLSAFARIGENMTICADDKAMRYNALLPDTVACRDLMALVEKGVVRGTSFEFSVRDGGDKWEKRGEQDLRTITDARLVAVNPVMWPAYADSALTVSMRSARGWNQYAQDQCDYSDPTLSPDVAFAQNALSLELYELTDAQAYLRACPDGALKEYATAEVSESAESITWLIAFLTANGATADAGMMDRAKKTLSETRAGEKPTATEANQPPLGLWEKCHAFNVR